MDITTKKEIVAALHDRFSRSVVAIVTDYKGLDVPTLNGLRRKLHEAGIEYRVVKNSLLIRASENTDAGLIKACFKGPSAVALSYDDPVAPAKILTDFSKENKNLEIKLGVMSGKVLDLDSIKALSALPSREELLAQVLASFIGVPSAFVRTLNAISQQFLNVLTAIKDQKAA